jgi:hypothetical protein
LKIAFPNQGKPFPDLDFTFPHQEIPFPQLALLEVAACGKFSGLVLKRSRQVRNG